MKVKLYTAGGGNFLSIEKRNANLVATQVGVENYIRKRVKNPAVAEKRGPKVNAEEWQENLNRAVTECADAMRRGEDIDWSKYRSILGNRTSTIWSRARAIVRNEEEVSALLGPAVQMSRSSAYQYLMFLCLLLGLLSAKPLVAFRDESRDRNPVTYQR